MPKSGASSEIISLPKGGGAIQGIGETFSPDLFTGTGNFSVPIALPPGRNGFQPQLSLGYSTGNGNGPFGLGWALSVPGVTRKSSKGVPLYRDQDVDLGKRDTFILSGAEDLVPVTEVAPEVTRYQPRTEGLFARIDHHHGAEPNHWEVRSKDGLVSFYGTEKKPDGVGGDWEDPAVIADPDPEKRDHIFAWKLTETRDPFGNRIVYEYERDRGQEDGHRWDQIHLRRIRYVDYIDETTGNERFLVSVTFDYGPPDERPEHFSEYRAGFEIRTIQRCKRIIVRTHTESVRLVRTYELVYLDERVAAGDFPEDVLPLNGTSLLSQVLVVGHDEAQTDSEKQKQSLPPLEFDYTRFQPQRRRFQTVTGRQLPARSLASPDLELVDLRGNGMSDILEMNGTVRYWRNLGGGRFDLPRPMASAPAGIGLADPGVQLLDANGDGRAELMISGPPLAGFYSTTHDGEWDRRSFQRHSFAPSFSLEDPEVALVDLDGDGVTDVIRSGTRLECFFNDPHEGWDPERFVVKERGDLDKFPNVNFSDPRVRFADMSGDGLQDIALVHDGNIEYWPNLGHGKWGERIRMRNSPRFPFGYDPRQILIGDVDGDGVADLIFVDHCKVTLYINQGGTRWSVPIEIDGTPPFTNSDSVRLVDLLGNGTPGILWSADATLPGRPQMFFLDFTGGIKPYLLNEMNNHMGAKTRVAYQPSTYFYLRDQERPQTRWKTTLPFPVQVVAKTEVIDEFSRGKLTTEYKYHHGYWDGGEREFRGFGRVDQCDTETFDDYHEPGLHPDADFEFEKISREMFSPPTETYTWFHLGPVGEAFGEWEAVNFPEEYWPDDPHPNLLPKPPGITAILKKQDLPRRVKRDAMRTLRGSVLRSELYARDGDAREDRPYTVTEATYDVIEKEAPADPDDQGQPRIFFSHGTAQRVTQWERGNDPMTQFSFTDKFDSFGQSQRQTQIACPRDWRSLTDTDSKDDPFLATRSLTKFADPIVNDEQYMVNRVAKTTGVEIAIPSGEPRKTVLELNRLPNDSLFLQRISQTLNYYDGEPFVGLPLFQIGNFGALVRSESLVLTEDILKKAYKSEDPASNLPEIPPYLEPAGPVPWTEEYPPEFRTRTHDENPHAGYHFNPGDGDHARGYFAQGTRNAFDFQDPVIPSNRGLLLKIRDPLGGLGPDDGKRDTTIEFYRFEFLPEQVTNPVGLIIKADYDLRVLQPKEVTDANGNRSRVAFTPLGLIKHTLVLGKEGKSEGDILEDPNAPNGQIVAPSIRINYGLQAFDETGQPVFTRTILREHHVTELDVLEEERERTIESFEYTDGFGRLLQTRTQAEEVMFGDPLFGGNLLSVDQNAAPGPITPNQQVGPLPNVVVSGWQIYDNKGRVIEKFEPFFDQGFPYKEPSAEQFGQKIKMFYDPRGQVTRTLNPDGSEQRMIYGVPGTILNPDLTNPDVFEPTPWKTFTYDANDLAPLCKDPGNDQPLTARAPDHHHFTPANILVDALGRTVLAVERHRDLPDDPNEPLPPIQEFHTRSTYDIRGNLLTVTDAKDRDAFVYLYDLADNPLRITNIDAGVRRTIFNAVGNEIERRDSKGALILQAYDILSRPIKMWARDGRDQDLTLREHLEYGDGGDPDQPQSEPDVHSEHLALNRLGVLHRHYDEAGLMEAVEYDFKGNVMAQQRRVIDDEAILSVFTGLVDLSSDSAGNPLRVDWDTPNPVTLADREAELLDPRDYRTDSSYDALNRVKTLKYPEDTMGGRKLLRPNYNRAGGLERVTLDGELFVDNIVYDAKGQRAFIALGNGVFTRYAYDPKTFRLIRLRSERYSKTSTDPPTYTPHGLALQDLGYSYDLVGNILSIIDRTQGSGVANNPQSATIIGDPKLAALVAAGDALVRHFSYDPIYRLKSATGRESTKGHGNEPWQEVEHHGFNSGNHGTANQNNAPNLTRVYSETYKYDELGSMERLKHGNGNSGFSRRFEHKPGTNQLHSLTMGQNQLLTKYFYKYDRNGNMIEESKSRHFDWDYSDQMKSFRVDDGNGNSSLHAHYLYDAGGQRVKKLVRKAAGRVESTTYISGLFEHHRWKLNGGDGETSHLHVMDDQQRIAIQRVGPAHPEDKGPVLQYHLGEHLGSSNLVVDQSGLFINREEYTPYGESSFGSFGRKRYRFTGEERDEESGLAYHSARYYAIWSVRWISTDPSGAIEGTNLYEYVRGNPTGYRDPTGQQGWYQQWFYETKQFQQKVVATKTTRGFTKDVRAYAKRIYNLWGGKGTPDINHVSKPQALIEAGKEAVVSQQDLSVNRAQAAADKKQVEDARAKGEFTRNKKGIDESAPSGKRYQQPTKRREYEFPTPSDSGPKQKATGIPDTPSPGKKVFSDVLEETGEGFLKNGTKKVLKLGVKSIPLVPAILTLIAPSDASAAERGARAVAGEIGVGPIDAETVFDSLFWITKTAGFITYDVLVPIASEALISDFAKHGGVPPEFRQQTKPPASREEAAERDWQEEAPNTNIFP